MSRQDNFKKGTVEMMALALLSESDLYGYEICQAITQRSGNAIMVHEGSLYPVLYKLQDEGYISDNAVRVGRRRIRVYYHLEPSGRELLDELLEEYHSFEAGMTQFLDSCAPNAESSEA